MVCVQYTFICGNMQTILTCKRVYTYAKSQTFQPIHRIYREIYLTQETFQTI